MPHKKPAKKDDDQKNSKKGKSVKPGRTMGMGRGQPEEDSDEPDLDIDTAMLKARPLKMQKTD